MMCELGVKLKNCLDKNPAFLGEKGGVVLWELGVILCYDRTICFNLSNSSGVNGSPSRC